MTFEQYWTEVGKRITSEKYRSHRVGQVCYNLLYEVKPDLAMLIVGGNYDPFYDNEKLDSFASFIQDKWDDIIELPHR